MRIIFDKTHVLKVFDESHREFVEACLILMNVLERDFALQDPFCRIQPLVVDDSREPWEANLYWTSGEGCKFATMTHFTGDRVVFLDDDYQPSHSAFSLARVDVLDTELRSRLVGIYFKTKRYDQLAKILNPYTSSRA